MSYDLANMYIGNISVLDVSAIILYLLICLLIGIRQAAQVKNIQYYALGGNLNTAVVAAIIYASYLADQADLSNLVKIGITIMFAALISFLSMIKWIIFIDFFSKKMSQFVGCITIGDIMNRLYNRSGKIITCIVLLFVNIISVSVQILALSYLLYYFLDIPITYSIIVGCATLIFYVALGGRASIAAVDLIQFAIFYVIIPVVVTLIIYEVGDLTSVVELIPAETWQEDLLVKSSNKQVLASIVLYAFLPAATGIIIQRFLLARKVRQLYKALLVITVVSFAIVIMISIFSLIVRADIEVYMATSIMIENVIANLLPTFIRSFIVVGAVAIIMATADSYINVTGVLTARDIAKNLFPNISDRTKSIIAQFSAWLAIIISAVFALTIGDISPLIWLAVTFYASLIVIPMIAGFFYFRTNSISFLASIIGGFAGILIGYLMTGEFALLSTLFGMIGNGVLLFLAHFLQVYQGTIGKVSEKVCESNWHKEMASELGVDEEELGQKLSQLEEKEFRRQQRLWILIKVTIRNAYRAIRDFRLANVLQFCYEGISSSPPQYYQFAAFGLFYAMYPMLFFEASMEKIHFAEEQPLWLLEIILRVLAGLVAIGIGLYDMWGAKINVKYFPLYWYLAIIFCLPVVGIYSYLVEPNENSVLMGTVLGIFALAAFVDWMRFWVTSLLGFIIANILYCLFSILADEVIYYGHDVISGYTIYLFIAIAMAFLVRYAQQREMQTIKIFSGAIAHEVKSPVASAYTAVSTLLNVLNKSQVSEPQMGALGNKVRHIVMNESDYNLMQYISNNVKTLLSRGMKSSEIMLMALSGINRAQDLSIYSVNELISKVLENYGLTEEEKIRIKFDNSHDFKFYGSSNLLSNVLYNLLGNALKYAGSNAKIEIWTKGNSIHFKDYGKGIKAEDLPHIFDLFYTKEAGGTGIGLALCKNIVTLMGGEIFCNSLEGKFTEFTIVFPPVKVPA